MLRKFLYILPIGLIGFISCKKTLDINTDPNNPTTISISKLLPAAVQNLGNALAIGNGTYGGLSQILSVYTHQMSTREEPDVYGVTGNDFYLANAWSTFYQSFVNSSGILTPGVLNNLEQIIKDATASGNPRYAGIAKILKAYTYSQLVDVFGDIPYSEAIKLIEGNKYPKFDNDAEIYPQLFTLLDEGIADVSKPDAENTLLPGSDDVIYKGDADLWVKAANTIKLKMYTQVRLVQDVSAQVTALLTGPLISATNESFIVPYGTKGATDDRNPGYGDYYATQKSNHVSPWLYEIMKGKNPAVLTGINDPRIPYYIYNQIDATSAPRDGNQTEYRDGPFISLYFGSVGQFRDGAQDNSISVYGIYPVGGKFDDSSAETVNDASGSGAAPYRLITYADRLYLEAELMKTGVIAGDAKAKFEEAMVESFMQVDYVVKDLIKDAAPALSGTAAVSSYTSAVLAKYDAGNDAKKLEYIMTEKWLSSFGSAVDQYTDYRRTGYPVLFDPNNPSQAPNHFVQPPVDGDPVNPGAQAAVPVQLTVDYPLSLPWYTDELETNPNAPSQKLVSTYKVFWMP
ncbi:MAG: SusD/RagB family nutrient-binding outer membrane lipoprotein [Ginsengibacter sp.]